MPDSCLGKFPEMDTEGRIAVLDFGTDFAPFADRRTVADGY